MVTIAELWSKEFAQKGIPSSFRQTPSSCVLWFEEFVQLKEVIAKLHGSEKSMILSRLERQGDALPTRYDGGLPRRAGEEARVQDDSKGRFYAPKSFAIASKGRLLDIGAGKGRNGIYLSSKGFQVSCLDVVEENVQLIRDTNPQIDARCCDVTGKLPYENETFDFAMDIFCFKHQVEEAAIQNYLCELKRVLKKGGLYLLSLASVDDGYYGSLLKQTPNPRRMIVDPHTNIPSILYRRADVESTFKDFKLLEFLEKKNLGPMHGQIYARANLSFIFQL